MKQIKPFLSILLFCLISTQAWACETIYQKHVLDNRSYFTKDGLMIVMLTYYDLEFMEKQGYRYATEEEIEQFWKRAHPEWYR